MIHDIQDRGFYKLRFHNRGNHLNKGLHREYNRSFRNCVDIACKTKLCEIFEEIFVEHLKAPQILDILHIKMKVLYIVDYLIQTAADGIPAAGGILPVECVKNHNVICVILKIPLHHGKLIKIGQKCEILNCHDIFSFCCFFYYNMDFSHVKNELLQ